MLDQIPLSNAKNFNLDVSGIAGFFGGEEAFAAMSSVHLVRGRRWFGWYNSPGSYIVAKRYGVLARSRIWDGLFPGVNLDPTEMLGLDGKSGPKFVGVHSGTRMDASGHLAHLLAKHCGELAEDCAVGEDGKSPLFLTYVLLADPEGLELGTGRDTELKAENLMPFDPVAFVPILYSVGAAVVCGVFQDWFSFSMIVLGILCNGAACWIIGSGALKVKGTNTSPNSPAADGIFLAPGGSNQTIIVKGSEKVIATLLRGRYFLHYPSQWKYHDIGACSLALTMQFLLQLFIIPQGQLFGQIMFLSTFAVSWLYNAYLASVDREVLQKRILLTALLQSPKTWKVRLPKYTTVAVLATLLSTPKNPREVLDSLLPNNTDAWIKTKDIITEGVVGGVDPVEVLRSSNIEFLSEKDEGLARDMINLASLSFKAAEKCREYLGRMTPQSSTEKQSIIV